MDAKLGQVGHVVCYSLDTTDEAGLVFETAPHEYPDWGEDSYDSDPSLASWLPEWGEAEEEGYACSTGIPLDLWEE